MTPAQPNRAVEFANSGIAATYVGRLLRRLGASVTRTQSTTVGPGTPLGEHNRAVFGTMLGLSNDSMDGLIAAGLIA